MNTTKITLTKPFKRGDKQVTEVLIREPVAGELRGVNLAELMQMEVNTVGKVLERVSEPMIDSATFSGFNPRDLTNLSVGLISFFVDTSSSQT